MAAFMTSPSNASAGFTQRAAWILALTGSSSSRATYGALPPLITTLRVDSAPDGTRAGPGEQR